MSLSAIIAPQLPYLRRYARALSGSRVSGDAYVLVMLEALIEDPLLFDEALEPRTALYKTFSRIWNATPMSGSGERLENVTPLPRQAFLLTALEGFTADQAASVLDVNAATFARLIESVCREIGAQVATTVLIVEDEPIIAWDLERLVEDLGHSVVEHARTRDEAVAMALQHRPGLILTDIRLADGSSGIDAIHDILQSFEAAVIFITAYPETLLTGEGPEPAFLIVKPFEADMVRAVISQTLFFHKQREKEDLPPPENPEALSAPI